MRNLRTKLTRSKQYRRTTLLLMILTASASMAQEPQQPEMRNLPPLPLVPIDSQTPETHPFCQQESVKLENGDSGSRAQSYHSASDSIRIKALPAQLDFRAIAQSRTIKSLTPIDLRAIEVDNSFMDEDFDDVVRKPSTTTLKPFLSTSPTLIASSARHSSDRILVQDASVPESSDFLQVVVEPPLEAVTSALDVVQLSPIDTDASTESDAPPVSTESLPAHLFEEPLAHLHESPDHVVQLALPKPMPLRQTLDSNRPGKLEASEPIFFSLSDRDAEAGMPLAESTAAASDPPLTLSKAPVPVTRAKLPVVQTQVSVAQTQLPVVQTQLPVAQTQLPVAQTQLPVAQTQLPVAQTQVSVAQIPVSVSETPLPVSKMPLIVSGGPIPVTQTQVSVSQLPVTVSEAPSSVTKRPLMVSRAPVPVAIVQEASNATYDAVPHDAVPHDAVTHGAATYEEETFEASNAVAELGTEDSARNLQELFLTNAAEQDSEGVQEIRPLDENVVREQLSDRSEVAFAEIDAIDPIKRKLPSSSEPAPIAMPLVEEAVVILATPVTAYGQAEIAPLPMQDTAEEAAPPVVIRRKAPRLLQPQQLPTMASSDEQPTITEAPQPLYDAEVAYSPIPKRLQRSDVAPKKLEKPVSKAFAQTSQLAEPAARSIVPANVKLTPLYMKSAQVRSLTVAGELRDVQVADANVCQAVTSGPNELKLIGTGDGVTQLVVWAKTDDPKKPIRMRAFEIHVDRVAPEVQEGGKTALLLSQSIRHAFPDCNVVLSQKDGGLVVSGYCNTEEAAERIIRMVRKTCTVTVEDQLQVR